jgi:polysaccharide export outer membrane protein
LVQSCKTKEKLVYFSKNQDSDSTSKSNYLSYTPKLKIDDFVSIIVTDEDIESVALFNLKVNGNVNSSYEGGNLAAVGYLIDRNGDVNLPVIGKLKIAGLYRDEAITYIESKLKNYFKNPIVQIQILNYKVTVLGEVNSSGTFKIPNERITILEAIGLAGDLKITGVRNNVLVVREENGIKKEFRVDLTSKSIFNSEVYYLHQNDVVYVEPNMSARSNSTFVKANGGILLSITSLIVTTVILILR